MKIYLYIGLISIFGVSNAMEKSVVSSPQKETAEGKEKRRSSLLTALSALNLTSNNAPKSPSSRSSSPRVRINEKKNETRTFEPNPNQEKGELGPLVRKHRVEQFGTSALEELLEEYWDPENNDNDDDKQQPYRIYSKQEEYLD